ncbi:MAG: tetratricopeptide repeat protein [Promethearchaeota archaeon]
MSYIPPDELKLARQLLDEDKYQETLQILNKYEKYEGITTEDLIECLLIKGELHLILHQYLKGMRILERAFQLSKNRNNKLQTFDSLSLKVRYPRLLREHELSQILNQLENIYLSFNDVSPNEKLKREALLHRTRGAVSFFFEYDYEKALNFYNRSLTIYETLGNKAEIAFALLINSNICFNKGDLSKSLKYAQKSLKLNRIRKRDKAWALSRLTAIFLAKGELDQALEYSEQLKTISEEINNPFWICLAISNIGYNNRLKGELDKALEYYKKALIFSEEYWLILSIPYIYFDLIRISTLMDSYEEAKNYLLNFKSFIDEVAIKDVERMYQLSEGIVLKASSNLRDHFKAEMILKDFISKKNPEVHYIITGITHLCDLLLMELRRTNDLNILDELNPLIARFSKTAEDQGSYWRLSEAKILQAKLALIQMNMGEARRFLAQAQVIADEHGLGILAQKISGEHDILLNQLSKWEQFKEEDAPVSKRVELSSLDEVVERLLEKRTVEPPKIMDEVPVLLLIIAEGGVLLFSYPFTEEWERDNELFGSFLSAITSFSNEFLSQGLDRVKFSQFTVLMEPIAHYSVYYVFKGQSYLAKQKLSHFIDLIQDEDTILRALDKYYQTSQIIELKDYPFLKVLLKEVFIKRNSN